VKQAGFKPMYRHCTVFMNKLNEGDDKDKTECLAVSSPHL